MPVEIISFHPDLIAPAGALLAARHERDRASRPELPARFEEPAAARAAVAATWQRPHASGVAVVQGDDLRGFLIGDMSFDPLLGRSAWVRLPGCAAIAPAWPLGAAPTCWPRAFGHVRAFARQHTAWCGGWTSVLRGRAKASV